MLKRVAYMGVALDRAAEQRRDADWLRRRMHDRRTRFLPVWRNCNLVLPGASPAAVFLAGATGRELAGAAEQVTFLGLDDGDACFALDFSGNREPPEAALTEGAEFVDLRQTGALMQRQQAALLAYARGMMYWHRHSGFCGTCGHPTESAEGGHVRVCTHAACARQHFPRTDPAVIMLVTSGDAPEGACLLCHQGRWPDGMYSTLAGFVDIGESLEEAVEREVFEETGVTATDARYQASQPWPFPASLMLGFRARATSTAITFDGDELEDARWFTREEIARFEGAGRHLPRPDSIARWLVERWLAGLPPL